MHIKGFGKFENTGILITNEKINIIKEWIEDYNKRFINIKEEYSLDLSNEISKYGEEILYSVSKKMAYITQLNLSYNNLLLEDIVLISFNLKKLTSLNISNIKFINKDVFNIKNKKIIYVKCVLKCYLKIYLI